MDDHTSGAYGGTVSDFDRADDHRVASDVHAIADNRAIIGALAHADCRGMAQCAIGSNDGFIVDDERVSVEKPQSRTNLRLVIQLDAHFPIHQELINGQVRKPEPSQAAGQMVQFLGETEGGQHELAADIARVRGPILQDASGHLICRMPMRVRFYLPETHLPSAEKRAAWFQDGAPVLEQEGKVAASQSWICRTWAALSNHGCNTELVHEFPKDGCVIALSGTLSSDFRPPEGVFLAGVVADGLPHPWAHLHIVQNAAHARRLPRSLFMPHWPQPGLVPRDAKRGSVLERVAFFGAGENLAAELKQDAWNKELKRRTGAIFEIRGCKKWSDYSDIDAVVAIRDFRRARQLHKPATKLYNAWLAGVPFIGGLESAYMAEGNAGRDFLAARTPHDVISHLETLKNNGNFRLFLVESGSVKSACYTPAAIAKRWKNLVEEELPRLGRIRARRHHWVNFCGDSAMSAFCTIDRVFRN